MATNDNITSSAGMPTMQIYICNTCVDNVLRNGNKLGVCV